MYKNALIIDNDERYSSILKATLENDLHINYKEVNDFESLDTLEDVGSYDLYFIRLNSKTTPLIDTLSDDDKIILVLTTKDDNNTRDKILGLGVTDYLITNNNSRGDAVKSILTRLISNTSKNIMIVDDSSLILNTLTILLDTQNLSQVRCKDGVKAWEYLNDPDSQKIDLIITDYEMPNMNGYELVKRVRSKYSKEELPVLILSGTEESSMIARFLKAGANDYIPKPFINEEFINRVSNTLSNLDNFRKTNS